MLEENADDKYKSGNVRNSKLIYFFKQVEKSGKKKSVDPLWSNSKILEYKDV